MRTTPDITHGLKTVEEAIRHKFIPSITGRQCNDVERKLYSLPARYGGLGIINPQEIADMEYGYSIAATQQIVKSMLKQNNSLLLDSEDISSIKKEITSQKNSFHQQTQELVIQQLPSNNAKLVELACEKGSSSWLTTLPLEEYGFVLNKQEFQDSIALRYGYGIKNVAKICICGQENSIDHCLVCKRGGFVSLRHNSLRDTTANFISQVCKDVCIEPQLLPLSGEVLPPSSITADEARLDISARSFWTPLGRAFFDIRVLHPGALTNASRSIPQMYTQHEQEKKRKYNMRVTEIEKGTFTPLVFSTTGGMSKETSTFLKRLATLLSQKNNQTYADTMSFVRRRLRFDLLKTTLIALRGHRGKFYEVPSAVQDLDINLQRDLDSL